MSSPLPFPPPQQQEQQQQQSSFVLTSTTAPGKVFESREELALHYKSDWHKYNLKRREAGLPVVLEGDFKARLEAAKALRGGDGGNTKNNKNNYNHRKNKIAKQDHLKKKQKSSKTLKNNDNKKKDFDDKEEDNHKKHQGQEGGGGSVTILSPVEAYDRIKKQTQETAAIVSDAEEEDASAVMENDNNIASVDDKNGNGDDDQRRGEDVVASTPHVTFSAVQEQEEESHNNISTTAVKEEAQHDDKEEEEEMLEEVINPRQCLFDRHISATVQGNVERMRFKYGFFIPDREYLVDLEGLVGYCHEKIQLGHMCLWCQRVLSTSVACRQHMVSKRHTKLLYQAGHDLEDLSVFYDFTQADQEFLTKLETRTSSANNDDKQDEEDNVDDKEGGEDGWEDVTDDEEEEADEDNNKKGDEDVEDDDDDENFYNLYKEEVARMGLDVTPLGELVFPDGRIVGHRALRHYYKQHLPSRYRQTSVAVTAARIGASERLYRGRVYNLLEQQQQQENGGGTTTSSQALTLSRQSTLLGTGIVISGRAGKGILVKTGGGGGGGGIGNHYDFSKLSVYRYRAAIRKERLGEQYGRRLHQRANQNLNRMDKKANRLMNGVSVAHAAR